MLVSVENRYDDNARKYQIVFDTQDERDVYLAAEAKATKAELAGYWGAFTLGERSVAGEALYNARKKFLLAWKAKLAAKQPSSDKELA